MSDPTYSESGVVFSPEVTTGDPSLYDQSETPDESEMLSDDTINAAPLPPIILPKRPVSGRYRSGGNGFQLELRVDVDRARPMNRISGDFFSVSGSTKTYFGSFIVNSPTITKTASLVTIEGLGQYTWSAGAPKIKVTIPRVSIIAPPASATVKFFTTTGVPGATYLCPFISAYFRTVQWEQDCISGTVPFVTYNTGAMPQPPTSPVRDLTVIKAYGEAGVEVQSAGTVNVINNSEAGPDAAWDDSELHNAMVNHFSLFANVPQWKVWLVVATSHIGGYRGIMFDYSDSVQRQGCAVFYNAIQGNDSFNQRAQLRTYVHELGHCFNLLHSWQKNLANPPAPLGPNGGFGDLSWMNYPQNYVPGGTAGYWANFPFQFTDNEVIHLRHAFYRNIINGGKAFGTGAAEVDPELFSDRIEDNSGLKLDIRAKEGFRFGEPVVVELKLTAMDLRGKRAHTYLHPNTALVQIAIKQPSGRTVVYRPMIEHCVDEDATVILNGALPAIYDSAYIGYGKDGFYFDQPGVYQLRALYLAPDGSQVVSPTFRLRVRAPHTATDEEVGELLIGEEQGQLLYLLGSDCASLRKGNEALEVLLERYSQHPLSVYARLVKGVNAERDFKHFGDSPEVKVRAAEPGESIYNLSTVVDASLENKGVDDITLHMVMTRLARAQRKAGETNDALATTEKMAEVFKQKKLKSRGVSVIASDIQAMEAAAS